MPPPRRLPAFLALAALASPGPRLDGQAREACLSPDPQWAYPILAFPSGPSEGDGNGARLYLAEDGRVCSLLRSRGNRPPQSASERVPGPGRAFLSSALFPGLGQRTLGLDRWAAYMAGEVWAWIQFGARRSEGRDLRSRYRDLAWLVARRVSSGPRVDGNFEYYEALTQFNSSGAYDADPDRPGVQPEEDPETFNGSIWALSREIYFRGDPEEPVTEGSEPFIKALKFYTSRAYAPELAWSWGNEALQQAEFTNLIRKSDENLRRSTAMVGLILANHLLSAVDAWVSAKLGESSRDPPTVSLQLLPGMYAQDTFLFALNIPVR